jgi:hypothetical protein
VHRLGARSRSLSGGRQKTTPTCANSPCPHPDAEYIRCAGQPVDPLGRRPHEAFAPAEAQRILRRLSSTTPGTPAGSICNEIEIGVPAPVPDPQNDDPERLINEIAAGKDNETPPAPASMDVHNRCGPR